MVVVGGEGDCDMVRDVDVCKLVSEESSCGAQRGAKWTKRRDLFSVLFHFILKAFHIPKKGNNIVE
jgi:hypothetical protein